MAKYRYETTDAQGNRVTGEVDGAGTEEARQKLAAQGLDGEQARLTEVVASSRAGRRLSDAEAAEVGSQIAQLAKAGLPLAGGLRATAEEVRLGRVAGALRRLADQLDAGMSLEGALESQGRQFPAHIRGLIAAGVETGRLPEALEEFVDVEQQRNELRRRVWLAAAYPGVALGLVVGLFLLFSVALVPQFRQIYEEFDAQLPAGSQMLFWVTGPGLPLVIGIPVLLVAAQLAALLLRGVAGARRVLYAVPILGAVWRWAGLCNLSRLMALLLSQQIPLPEALRLTAAGLREPDLSEACRESAARVERGGSLSECVRDFWQFPPSLGPLVEWSERTSDPAAAFRAGAEMFETRTGISITLLQTILPPVAFLLILALVFFAVWGILGPLISLIQNLT
jgi:type II secretory pathway component PulF